MGKPFSELTPKEKVDATLRYDIEFPATECAYCQCMDDQTRLDEIKAQYVAMKARADAYKADIDAAADQAAIDIILGSVTRQ